MHKIRNIFAKHERAVTDSILFVEDKTTILANKLIPRPSGINLIGNLVMCSGDKSHWDLQLIDRVDVNQSMLRILLEHLFISYLV